MPVSGQYDKAILNLPKAADGNYYIDAATGTRYPVDPGYHLGRVQGQQWRRIREMAISQGWSRRQLIEFCQNPSIYQIEDAPGNLSHAFELPREAG
jgi:hypothetical protein